MTIGAFDQRIIISKQEKEPNGRGGAKITEAPVLEVWCKIRQANDREVTRYNTREIEINTILTIRYREELQPGKSYTGTIGTRKFEITTPVDKEQTQRFWTLPAKEVF